MEGELINRTLKWHVTEDPAVLNQIEMTPEHILYNSGIPRIGAFATEDVEFGENIWISEGVDIRRSKVSGSVIIVGVYGGMIDSEISGVVNIGFRQNDPEIINKLYIGNSKIDGCLLGSDVDEFNIHNSNITGNFFFDRCYRVNIDNSAVGHNINVEVASAVDIIDSKVDGNIVMEGDKDVGSEFWIVRDTFTGNNYMKDGKNII